jgi:hypothetical protein
VPAALEFDVRHANTAPISANLVLERTQAAPLEETILPLFQSNSARIRVCKISRLGNEKKDGGFWSSRWRVELELDGAGKAEEDLFGNLVVHFADDKLSKVMIPISL